MDDHFAEKGYNVFDLLQEDESEKLINEIWEYMGNLNNNIRREKSETWRNDNWPPNIHGIFKKYGAHSKFMWDIRSNKKLLNIYRQLWGTDDLSVSFDGFAMIRPIELKYVRSKAKNKEEIPNWLHCDQGLNFDETSYQSFVTLEDIDEDDACFVCLEKSHKYHDEFFIMKKKEIINSDISDKKKSDWINNRISWYSLSPSDIQWFIDKGCKFKRVTAKKGNLVMWNSKLIHSGSFPVKGRKNKMRWTIKLYVTYVPKRFISSSVSKRRFKLYSEGSMTGHDVRKSKKNQIRTYNKDMSDFKDEIHILTDEQQKLI